MRVLHWYPNYFGGGGVANAVMGLGRAQMQAGARVAIAAAEFHDKALYQSMGSCPEVLQWRFHQSFRCGSLQWRRMHSDDKEVLRRWSPDIVHVHGEFNPDNLYAPRLFNVPIVLSPHGAFHPVVLRKSRTRAKRLYIAVAARLLYRRAALFHALSLMEEAHIRTLLPTARTCVIPHGASPHVVPKVVTRSGDESRSARFIFVGRLDVHTKGLDILLEGFSTALIDCKQCVPRLVLVGPDWRGGRAVLTGQAQRLGCLDRVEFTGAVPGDEVADRLSASDVYIQVSRHEGFPLALAEALLSGLPAILSSEIGPTSCPEVAGWPHIKIVAPRVEAVRCAILDSLAALPRLKQQAHQALGEIRNFLDWTRVGEMHLEAYERLGVTANTLGRA
jgi:glycosyltransferase involved in cell wall biosynthesis